MVRVLVYEDNDDFRGALTQFIESASGFACIGAFRDCLRLEEQMAKLKPNLVLMDIDIPGPSGIDGLRLIRKEYPDLPVIMLTVFDDNKHVLEAILAGASGYLLKKDVARKLFNALDEVLAGGAPLSMNVARMMLEYVNSLHAKASKDVNLTIREKEILVSLMNGNNNKMIAHALGISIETVKTHIKNIYEKLQVHTQAEAVAKVLRDKLL